MKGKKKEDFDYQNFEQQALKAMYEGKSLEQVLGPLLKRLVEAGLQGEMQTHLEDEKASGLKNRRNGTTGKSVRSRFGELNIETPRYSLKRWDKLTLYAQNGQLEIDNNPIENAIRPVAVGRKNYLFAGSHDVHFP